MIEGLKPYLSMKDSGVPWLGKVPEHWVVLPICALARRRQQTNEQQRELLSVYLGRGVVPFSSVDEKRTNPTSEDLSKYQAVEPGDFVLNNQQAWRGSVGVSRYKGIVSPAYLVLALDGRLNQEYADRLLSTPAMVTQYLVSSKGVGSIQRNLYWPHLRRVAVLVPPSTEQAAIVRFLGHADRKIRRYIRAKHKLIKLLEEQKQAIIHRSATRGLDPNVRLKPSGVEWLGDVPEHWELKRVKQAAKILRGKFTHRSRNDPALYNGAYPFIQTGEVARAEMEITQYRQTLNARGLAVSKMFPSGTLVMTIAANIGDVALLEFEACFPDSIVGFIPRTGVERDFLYYLFRAMKVELLREAPVNTQGNLNVDRIGSRAIALPPANEQDLIVLSIEADTARLSDGIKHACREIDLLHEYRTRLIADLVTGKLDVREAAAKLFDEDQELPMIDELDDTSEPEEDAFDDLDGASEEPEP
jgi:type I restriction enzyme S subunit